MNFSLKTMLITLCGAGALIGLMGKLLLESPETFLLVLRVGSTVVPFLLTAGTIIWLGLRGKRRWGLVAWGGLLLVTPVVVTGGLMLLWPSGDPLRMLSNWRLIAQRLPSQADAPWVWQELTRRLKNGDLTGEEVDDAIGELTAFMKLTAPAGWNRPLAWQDDFVAAAIQKRMISEDVFLDFCDAFFSPQPVVQLMLGMTWSKPGFRVEANYGSPWSDDSGVGIKLLWHVKQVLLDDSPIKKVKPVSHIGNHWSGFCPAALSPGDHKISIVAECAYVDANLLNGLDLDQLPPAQWPKARKRWTTTVSVPVKVEPANQP